MGVRVVLGAQWGDEGKGKLVDIFAQNSDLVARAQGGNNAGHTIRHADTTWDFHLLPSGLLNPKCLNLIGTGCVVHVPSFFKELEDLQRKGLNTDGRILISDRATVVLDLHQHIDGLQEAELTAAAEQEQSSVGQSVSKKGGGAIGTTKKGIGPSYSSSRSRDGLRIFHIFNKEAFDRQLKILVQGAQKRYGSLTGYDVEKEIAQFDALRIKLAPFVVDAVPLIDDAQRNTDYNILVEGANALMLDVDFGTTPFTTSSSTSTCGVLNGLAIDPTKRLEIIGVVKAYTTRVGNGPFPSEQLNHSGRLLQEIGHETGVTTGRTRRCGWLDLVVLKYSNAVNHYHFLNLSKLDVLDTFPEIKIAVAYKFEGKLLESFPADLTILDSESFEVIYESLPGWQTAITGINTFEELPLNAKKYVEFIEERIGVRVKYIGTGVAREAIIVR